MPRALPPQAEARKGQADTLAGHGHLVDLLEVLLEQGRGPDGEALPECARVAINDRVNQRIHDSLHRAGTAGACTVRKTCSTVEGVTSAEAFDPAVDGSAPDPQAFGHRGHTLPGIEPSQGLGVAQSPGILGMGGNVLQYIPFLGAEGYARHHGTSYLWG